MKRGGICGISCEGDVRSLIRCLVWLVFYSSCLFTLFKSTCQLRLEPDMIWEIVQGCGENSAGVWECLDC